MRGLDFELLRGFAVLHRERNLTRAARIVGLSQPAMSRALGRMREQLGDELFVRTQRGMVSTPRADQLAPQIDRLLAAAEALGRPDRFEAGRLERRFVVATTDMFEADLMPRVIERLAASAPGVELTLRPITDHVDDALATGRIDLVIGVRVNVPPDALAVKLYEDGFLCAVREGHPGVGKRMTLAKFCELPHLQIAPRGEPGGAVDNALAALGLRRRVVVRTNGFMSAPAIVATSDLVLTAPMRVLRRLAEPFGLRLFTPPVDLATFSIFQMWHPRVDADPAHAWFRTTIAAVAQNA